MAIGEVYCKWSSQGDGNRAAGAWALMGEGVAVQAGPVNALNQHAERLAWLEAWGRNTVHNLRARVTGSRENFPNDHFQVKFWVDQQICPSCQKWLLVDVIAHLKQLSAQFEGMRVELFAEVLRNGVTTRVDVKRSTVWPVNVGLTPNYADLPVVYN